MAFEPPAGPAAVADPASERDLCGLLHEAILSSTAEGVIVLDTQGSVLYSNRAAIRLAGMSVTRELIQPAALRGTSIAVCRPDGTSLPAEERPYDRALRGETFYGTEVLLVLPGGRERRRLRVSGAPLRGPDGAVFGVVLIIDDAARQAGERAELSALLGRPEGGHLILDAILETIPDVVCVLDAELRPILLNSAGLKLLGVKDLEEARRLLSPDLSAILLLHDLNGQPLPAEERPARRALLGEDVVVEGLTFHHPVTGRVVCVT